MTDPCLGEIVQRLSETQERLDVALRDADAARTAAKEALARRAAALRDAADAHDDLAAENESAAASTAEWRHLYRRQVDVHRAAASRARERAERLESVLSTPDVAGPGSEE